MTATPDRRRVFLGIGLSDAERSLLASLLSEHIDGEIPGKPAPPDNWHITLRFLGTSDEVQRDRLVHALGEADLPPAFRLRLTGLGAFPRAGRAAVLWVGVGAPDDLASLAAKCEEAAVDAGFPAEERPFHAHLTLARIRPPVDVSQLIASARPFHVDLDVSAVTLFESHLSRRGARYEEIDRIDL